MLWRISRCHLRKENLLARPFSFTTYGRAFQHIQTKSPENRVELGVGDNVEGFVVSRIEQIPDFHSNFIQLKHERTGAEYVHIERNDLNNTFAIGFRTTPYESTGLPHILEHVTLCGSEKYPCRDPFMKMLNRSMATYLNASTAPDFTVYPFSTQNRVDYYNLMSVYLDAVFRPLIRRIDFSQEGWRLEHENVEDKSSPIVFKGVVFNEMKGVYSENQNIFMEALLNSLLPSNTYGYNSGGDPLEIPNLTYENLVNFHRKYYHPSNCRMYSYGNFSLPDHLKYVNDNYLEKCDKLTINTAVPSEPRWTEPKRKHILGKNDPLATNSDKQSILSVSFGLHDIRDIDESFAVNILSQLLTDGPNSNFYKTLIESNIGTGYAPFTGYNSDTRDTTFAVGLQGMSDTDFDKVREIVKNTFEDAAKNGFNKKNVENILHSMELSLKNERSNFGLHLLYAAMPIWNHEGDVADSFSISDKINKFRKEYDSDSRFLQRKVERYFLDNKHELTLTMSPDVNYDRKLEDREKQLLTQKLSILTQKDLNDVYDGGLALRKEQEKVEDVSILPTLHLSDISDRIAETELQFSEANEAPVQICELSTNGVTYFRAILDASDLSAELKPLLPLFCDVATEMGTKSHDYRIFDQLVMSRTNGLSVSNHVVNDLADENSFEDAIILSSYCLDKNVQGMFELWRMLLNELNLTDVNRFATLVRNIAGDASNGIADNGHGYAMLNSSSRVSGSAYRKELYSGLTYVRNMKEIAQLDRLEPVLEKMKSIANHIVSKKRVRFALNISPGNYDALPNLKTLVTEMAGSYEGVVHKHTSGQLHDKVRTHYVLPFGVNYVAKCGHTIRFADAHYAAARVAAKLSTTKVMLPLVREKFGAYGAGAKVGSVVQFYSYRDPNTSRTLDTFDSVATYLRGGKFTDNDMIEAKLAVFRDLDAPVLASSRGMRFFLSGIDDETYQKHRMNVLNVGREQIAQVAEYFETNDTSSVVLGPENEEIREWNKIYCDQ